MGYLFTYNPHVVEPLSVPEAKAHLRVDFADDDDYIASIISAARWKLEREFRRAIVQQTLVLALDFFGTPERTRDSTFPVSYWPPTGYQYPINSTIDLRPPVQSITSVKYYDPSMVLQTVLSTAYLVDTISEPGRISPTIGVNWPTTANVPNAVQITFVAGHTDPTVTPENIKQALRLVIGNFYENREETVIGTRLVALALPDGVDKLMAPFRHRLVR